PLVIHRSLAPRGSDRSFHPLPAPVASAPLGKPVRYLLLALILLAVLGAAVVITVRRLGPALVRAAFSGSHVTVARCPRCRAERHRDGGRAPRGPGCGERVAACAYCGPALAGPAITRRARDGQGWLCAEHYEAQEWEAQCLRELGRPENQVAPPATPRAL